MNVADLDALIKSLSDPELRKVLEHKDWPDVYAHLLDIQEDREEGLYDLDDDTKFVHVLNKVTLYVQDGKIWADDNTIATDAAVWNGEDFVEPDEEDDLDDDQYIEEHNGPESGEEDGPE